MDFEYICLKQQKVTEEESPNTTHHDYHHKGKRGNQELEKGEKVIFLYLYILNFGTCACITYSNDKYSFSNYYRLFQNVRLILVYRWG